MSTVILYRSTSWRITTSSRMVTLTLLRQMLSSLFLVTSSMRMDCISSSLNGWSKHGCTVSSRTVRSLSLSFSSSFAGFFSSLCPCISASTGGLLFYIIGTSVGAGAHRLWSHRSYKASNALKIYLMLGHTLSGHVSRFYPLSLSSSLPLPLCLMCSSHDISVDMFTEFSVCLGERSPCAS